MARAKSKKTQSKSTKNTKVPKAESQGLGDTVEKDF